MEIRLPFLAAVVLVTAGVFLPGCARGVKLVPVTGTVTYQGKVVPSAMVLFMPDKGPPAMGKTDSSGRFSLKTSNLGDGAIPGQYAVSITANETSGVFSEFAPDGGGTAKVKWLIPEKYSIASSSGLSATVSRETSDYSFRLP